ncbi:hypothetical protein PMZ66_13090 [Clostridium paraputrificum]|uniref:hypothetical protein n=1 Tax=Clostridium paraputrificum TaxID=29363 RepID=UPI00232B5851|nr:hypothetical protein [Clostridium paraputrificum]MDB2076546.1 hypothetical protein [Clostridium paraputrificum]MDB2080073.1 hypothetical protein [Clostridium paraputrificum]
MRITEERKKKLTNIRVFKYRGKVHIVSNVKVDNKGFTGCFGNMCGVKYCLINANLSPMEKQRALHRLIKEKYLTRG